MNGSLTVFARRDFQNEGTQWLMLLNMSDEIRTFIADNEAKLKTKD